LIGGYRIAVVIPCYRVVRHILTVIQSLPESVDLIVVVDDGCPEKTAETVIGWKEAVNYDKLTVCTHTDNAGVGAAMRTGYRVAIDSGADIIIKMDGDGQMNPELLPMLVSPIVEGVADYTKGNRFFDLDELHRMPTVRLFGNAMLSLVNKFSSGYWDIMDPTNGFTAIHKKVALCLPLQKVASRYFFESDMLFRLNTLRAVVQDVPMPPLYGNEKSSLSIVKIAFDFPSKYINRFIKRIFYTYFLRDFNAGSVQIILGSGLLTVGAAIGAWHWLLSIGSGVAASSGTVMLAALPVLLGSHLLIGAINFDIANVPRRCLHRQLP
jgi:dolichol-phosphate mannosyltransferase